MKNDERKYTTGMLLGRFMPYYKKYLPTVVIDLFCAALTTVCEIILPLIMREITNAGMSNLASLTVGYI